MKKNVLPKYRLLPGKRRHAAGLTLMELLVATILVGIVMVGTVSIDYAIRSIRKSTSDASTVALQTSATMIRITNDVSKAVGNAGNLGIVVDAAGPPTWFCARQDTNLNADIDSGDNWICYWKPVGASDQNIYTCTRPVTGADGSGGAGSCAGTTPSPIVGTAGCVCNGPGGANDCSSVNCATYAFTFSLTNNPAARQFYFNIALTNRADPAQAVDPAKPMKNPQYSLSSRIAPLGHSY